MTQKDSEFGRLIERLRQGSVEAVWDLAERYADHIRRVVRRTLDRQLRPQFDSEDFVQSLWHSMCRNPAAICKCDTPDDLVGFLVRVAQNKVWIRYHRAFRTKKYDQTRVTSIEAGEELKESLVSRDPDPLELAIARERWNRLFQQQPPKTQEILKRRIAGASCVEIARQMQISERTVRRTIDRLVTLR